MANFNQVILMGRLTEEPELKFVGSGAARTRFGMAVNRVYKNAAGEKQEETLFVNIVCWNALAENVAKYMSKGKPVFVEGRLRIDSFDNAEGERKKVVEVVAHVVEFLGGRDDSSAGAQPVAGNVPYTGSEEVPF